MGKLIVVLIILVLSSLLGAWLWPYSINTWLVFLHRPPCVVGWQGALLGFCPFLGQATVPVAVITWILMLFLR